MFYLHLPTVFDKNYCSKLIELGNRNGFIPAAVNYYGEDRMRKDIRNNSRSIWDDRELAKELEKIIAMKAGANFPISLGMKNQSIVGFGDHFRMYRYKSGEYFKPHRDGKVQIENIESLVTALIYLNDTDGGETILMPDGFSNKDSWVIIEPHMGDVLLFQHDCWHEGRPVSSGEKYVLRTDIFYNKN